MRGPTLKEEEDLKREITDGVVPNKHPEIYEDLLQLNCIKNLRNENIFV